jgi:type VI secretion system protein ImpA
VMDPQQLLPETVEKPPCGPNLEYDPAFLELERAGQGKREQQFGNLIIPSEEPDWGGVRERAEALLRLSKDLRVAIWLARSLIHELGVAGLASGLSLIVQLLERYWDAVHPQLDADDGNDPTMRINALAPLVDPDGVLRDVRRSVFLRSRSGGNLLVRDVEGALGKLPAPAQGKKATPGEVESIVRAAATEDMAPVHAVKEAAESLAGLNRLLAGRVGVERAPDLRPLAAVVGSLQQVCDKVLGTQGAPAGMPATEAVHASPMSGMASLPVSEVIGSREDAIRLLDKVCEYLERHEPANPAPLLIRRAKRLMTMGFVDIINDLVPESLVQIQTIAGVKTKEER